MTAIKLSLITGRSRKANIKRVKTLLLMKWTVCENILANHETAVGIYNQQIIQRHWNNNQQSSFCFSFTHKICKKIPYIRTSHHAPLFLLFFHCKYYFICYDKDSESKFVNTDHQKHSKQDKSAPEVDLSVWANYNNCHIRVFRLLSLLILKKCKSSSNAVNNNHQVTTKVYA